MPRKANCTWAGLENASAAKKACGCLFVQRRCNELPHRGRPRKCLRNERHSPFHRRQEGQRRRLFWRRPLDFSRQSPQHQIFAEFFNLVRQPLATCLVGRVDVRCETFHRLCAFGESELEIGGYVYQLPHQGDRRAQLRLEVRAVLRSKDEPSQPRRTDARIKRKPFLRHAVERPLRGRGAQDILHRLQAGLDSFGEVSGGMNPAENILNDDRHDDTDGDHTAPARACLPRGRLR